MIEAQKLILEMVADGATKTAIAKATGVTDMTILSVSQGKTKVFRKLKKLQSVYNRWKAGSLDLGGNRGKKAVVAPLVEESPAVKKGNGEKKASAGKEIKAKKSRTKTEPAPAVKTKHSGHTPKKQAVAIQEGFQIPDVTEEMVAGVEEQIRRLQAQAKYMRDLMKIQHRYLERSRIAE